MAKISKQETRVLTSAEAVALVKNVDGRVRFQVKVSAFLYTETREDGSARGYEGLTFINISRAEMMRVIPNLLSRPFEEKGARLHVRLDPPMFEGTAATVSVY